MISLILRIILAAIGVAPSIVDLVIRALAFMWQFVGYAIPGSTQ